LGPAVEKEDEKPSAGGLDSVRLDASLTRGEEWAGGRRQVDEGWGEERTRGGVTGRLIWEGKRFC